MQKPYRSTMSSSRSHNGRSRRALAASGSSFIVMLRRLTQAVTLMRGRRRAWVALSAGAVSALGQAPMHIWPILFLTFPLLVWLIDGAPSAGRGLCLSMSEITPAGAGAAAGGAAQPGAGRECGPLGLPMCARPFPVSHDADRPAPDRGARRGHRNAAQVLRAAVWLPHDRNRPAGAAAAGRRREALSRPESGAAALLNERLAHPRADHVDDDHRKDNDDHLRGGLGIAESPNAPVERLPDTAGADDAEGGCRAHIGF